MATKENQTNQGHHDTHAIPPQFIQEAYWHYNKIKPEELAADESVFDFVRGLSEQQKEVLKPLETISASTIETACKAFRSAALNIAEDKPLHTEVSDVTVYEHAHFPGLQIAPSILPPETQTLFVSQIMHKYLANPEHTINLEADYDIKFPPPSSSAQECYNADDIQSKASKDPALAPLSSFFTTDTQKTILSPKDSTKSQKCLNTAQWSSKLRWLTIGEQYHWPTRSYPLDTPTTFPSDLYQLVTGLFPHIKPESGVCLLYGARDYMPVHRDVSEQCQTGLASFSFGCDGVFVVAKGEEEAVDDEDRRKRTAVIRVRSGDCVHMTGETRWAWHAMARTVPGTCPKWLADWPLIPKGDDEASRWTEAEKKAFVKWKGYMGRKRLNVSCRQVWN